jgi:AcrR family transcriptional regulator
MAKAKRAQGSKAGLDQEMIGKAVLKTIDQHGIDDLSVRQVAKALGVEAMSLYNHFPSKRALMEGAFEALVGEVELPPENSANPKRALMEIAEAFRNTALKHPRAIPLFALVCPPSPNIRALLDRVCALTKKLGLDDEAVARWFVMQNHFIMGALVSDYVAIDSRERGPGMKYLPVPCANLERLTPYLSKPGAAEKHFKYGMKLLIDRMVAEAEAD